MLQINVIDIMIPLFEGVLIIDKVNDNIVTTVGTVKIAQSHN
tara:strand:- start:3131 stop:3256 length:126 start_codon:yes stop_codon:yes gene_type:complete